MSSQESGLWRFFWAPGVVLLLGIIAGCASGGGQPEVGSGLSLSPMENAGEALVKWPGEEERQERLGRLLEEPLDQERAVRVALLNQPGIQAARLEVEAQRGRLRQEAQLENPEVEVELYFSEQVDRLERLDAAVVVDVTSLFALGARRRAFAAGGRSTAAAGNAEILARVVEVRRAWVEAVGAEVLLERQRALYQVRAAVSEAAVIYHESGNLADDEVAVLMMEALEAREELYRAEDEARGRRERLSLLLGLSDQEFELPDGLPEIPEDQGSRENLFEEARQESWRLKALEAEGQRQQELILASRWVGYLPGVRLGLVTDWRGGELEWGPSLGVEIPLFNRRQGDRDAHQAERERMEFLYREELHRLEISAQRLERYLERAEQMVRHYQEEVLPLGERIQEEKLRQYNAMTIGVFELLEARRAHLRAEREYLRWQRDFWLRHLEIESFRAGVGLEVD